MAVFAGWALEHGFTNETWLAVTGGVVALVTVLWSLYTNSLPSMVKTVSKSQSVDKVVVSTALANKIDSSKVVGP